MSGIDNQRRDYEIHKKIHKHQAWLICAPLRVAVGRLRTKPLLHIGASLRHRRARPRPRSRTPSRRRHEGGGSWWAIWPDSFWLGRWSLSLQPPPLPRSPSRPSRTCVRVGPPGTQRGRPASPWLAAGCRIRVISEWRERPHGALPARSSESRRMTFQ